MSYCISFFYKGVLINSETMISDSVELLEDNTIMSGLRGSTIVYRPLRYTGSGKNTLEDYECLGSFYEHSDDGVAPSEDINGRIFFKEYAPICSHINSYGEYVMKKYPAFCPGYYRVGCDQNLSRSSRL